MSRLTDLPVPAWRSLFICSQFCDGTEGVCMYVCICVCVCMYVCVYVCDSATAQTDGWNLIQFSANDLRDICEVRFSRILKF